MRDAEVRDLARKELGLCYMCVNILTREELEMLLKFKENK